MNMIYKDRLKFLRDRTNTKEKDIKAILGIGKSLYSEYESEIKIMPVKHLNLICNYFNISFDYLFGLTEKLQYSTIKKDELNPNVIGKNLKEIRKELKLTQEKLADIVGCSYGTIAGYEIGRYTISTPILYKICKKYHISADYVLGRTNNPKYIKN